MATGVGSGLGGFGKEGEEEKTPSSWLPLEGLRG